MYIKIYDIILLSHWILTLRAVRRLQDLLTARAQQARSFLGQLRHVLLQEAGGIVGHLPSEVPQPHISRT